MHIREWKITSILAALLLVMLVLLMVVAPAGMISLPCLTMSHQSPYMDLHATGLDDSGYCVWTGHDTEYIDPIFQRLYVDMVKYSNMNGEQRLRMMDLCKQAQGVCTAITIRGGQLFVKQLGTGVFTRHIHVLQLFSRVSKKFYPLPDVDLVFETSDGNPDTGGTPRLMLGVYRPAPQGIMIPDETFYDFPEAICPGEGSHKFADFIQNATLRHAQMVHRGVSSVISNRVNEIFWRGARLTNPVRMQQLEKILNLARESNRTIFNIQPMQWVANSPLGKNAANGCVSLNDHCNYRYLLHLRGNTYSSRLKYLLLCGSVVFMPRQEYEEWWYPAIPSPEVRREDNEIIIETQDDISDFHEHFSHMYTTDESLPSERIQKTSLRTIEFALTVFSEKTVDCYLAALIHQAASSWGAILPNGTGRPVESILNSSSSPVEAFSDL